MKMQITQNFSKETWMQALDYLEIHIKEKKSILPVEALFTVAIRKNPKRHFLFVSKLLGKHLDINPKLIPISGLFLAMCYQGEMINEEKIQGLFDEFKQGNIDMIKYETLLKRKIALDKKVLFIGFAETATGIGHSMFRAFKGEVSYIHTTREVICDQAPSFTFEEEHSHATSHVCFTEYKNYFEKFEEVVLVDDEITTGNTALNLIKALYKHYKIKHYTVTAFLDWRDTKAHQKTKDLEKELGIEIHFISLVKGDIKVKLLRPIPNELQQLVEPMDLKKQDDAYKIHKIYLGKPLYHRTYAGDEKERYLTYIKGSGRFGITSKQNHYTEILCKQIGEKLQNQRKGERCLCIGTEEFMYLPALIASFMGEGITYQSTTRSPIIARDIENYPIRYAVAYLRPEDHSVINYLYNVLPGKYDEVFWFLERDVENEFKGAMTALFRQRRIKDVHFVVCGEKEQI